MGHSQKLNLWNWEWLLNGLHQVNFRVVEIFGPVVIYNVLAIVEDYGMETRCPCYAIKVILHSIPLSTCSVLKVCSISKYLHTFTMTSIRKTNSSSKIPNIVILNATLSFNIFRFYLDFRGFKKVSECLTEKSPLEVGLSEFFTRNNFSHSQFFWRISVVVNWAKCNRICRIRVIA